MLNQRQDPASHEARGPDRCAAAGHLGEDGIDKTAVPGVQLALYVVAAALAGVVAAIGPPRRASKVDVLRAVVTD
jgi:hypothetical protein